MTNRFFLVTTFLVGASTALYAQDVRRADIRGGGEPGRGKCTAEVVVDGAAEVEIRGDSAVLRTLNGRPAQWRRFECNAPMPRNPAEFRFAGVDGRGRQELVRQPDQGGGPVIRIEDPQGGAEAYTFDIFWSTGYNGAPQGYPQGAPMTRDRGYDQPQGRDRNREQALQVCQDSVRQQAGRRYGARQINFGNTSFDNGPGRGNWVIGVFENAGRGDTYRFSCAMNFNSMRVTSVNVDRMSRDEFNRYGAPAGPRYGQQQSGNNRAVEGCQRAVAERLRNDGYGRVDFRSINVNDRPGQNDQVVGVARVEGQGGPGIVDFSCAVELRDGDVRSVDVRPRQ